MDREDKSPFFQAASVLPEGFLPAVEGAARALGDRAEEFRLRLGAPLYIALEDGETALATPAVTENDLRAVLEQASRHSAHTVLDRVRAGFVTLRGGHRIGICGEAVMRDGAVHALDRLSSLVIRIARPVEGAGAEALAGIEEDGALHSALILAPPGVGKTTLLRELIRRISDGVGTPSRRVGLADERGEVAACWEGRPQFDVGRHTDVMSGCPKAAGMSILLRGMAPQVLAVDEITAGEDVEAMAWAAGCGVTLLCTAHGGSTEDLRRRPLYRGLMELGIFQRAVLLEKHGGKRRVTVEALI